MQRVINQAVIVVAVAALALLAGPTGAQARTEIQLWHALDVQSGDAALNELVKQFNQSQGEFEVKALRKGGDARPRHRRLPTEEQSAPHRARLGRWHREYAPV